MKKEILESFIEEVIAAESQISEIKAAALVSSTSPDIIDRSTKRSSRLSRVDKPNKIWTYRASGGGDYTVKIRVVGSLTKLGSGADIEITCNCPFFRWQGPEHWAKAGDYEYGPPAGTASFPKIMDPKRKKPICKHAVAALKQFEKSYVG